MEKGHYKVIQVLDITKSLLSQLCSQSDTFPITKCLLSNTSKPKDLSVVYFVDGCSFGPGTLIEIEKSTKTPLLKEKDYSVKKKTSVVRDLRLITKLLGK